MNIELKLGIKLICCIRRTIPEYDVTYNLILVIDRAYIKFIYKMTIIYKMIFRMFSIAVTYDSVIINFQIS